MVQTFEQIIEYIKNLSLKEVLIYLVSQNVLDFSKVGYERIKKIIIDKQNEGKYAFVPNKEEALFLQQSKTYSSYQQLEMLVPKYKYLDLIRTGFLIANYNKNIENNINPERYRLRISQIKEQIAKRPGGGRLLKIVKFPTTDSFSSGINYLYNLKLNNCPSELLEDEFEELVDDWEKSSKFVKHNNNFEEVIDFCKRQADQKNRRFSILGMYDKAIEIIEKALNDLNSQGFFEENEYIFKIQKSSPEISIITMEVIIFKKNL